MKINEDAVAGAVSATAVAYVPRRMGMIKRIIPSTPAPIKKKKKPVSVKESTFSSFLKEMADDADFNPADVIGALSQNVKQSDKIDGSAVATYGLETDDGGIVKVSVPREQAKEFEAALSDELRNAKDTNQQDIAELLFNLNNEFHIVDVVWPQIEEEEEPTGPADPNANPAVDPNAAPADPNATPAVDLNAAPVDPSMDPNVDPMGGTDTTADATDALSKVIDLMRADIDARKADADARTAEARAREAEAAGKTAEMKMSGDEEMMDAENHFDSQRQDRREAGKLKMLAKYKQQMSSGNNGGSDDDPLTADSSGGAAEEEESALRTMLLKVLRGK